MSLHLSVSGNRVMFAARDDGIGFTFKIARSRVRLIGGQVEVDCAPGKVTPLWV